MFAADCRFSDAERTGHSVSQGVLISNVPVPSGSGTCCFRAARLGTFVLSPRGWADSSANAPVDGRALVARGRVRSCFNPAHQDALPQPNSRLASVSRPVCVWHGEPGREGRGRGLRERRCGLRRWLCRLRLRPPPPALPKPARSLPHSLPPLGQWGEGALDSVPGGGGRSWRRGRSRVCLRRCHGMK